MSQRSSGETSTLSTTDRERYRQKYRTKLAKALNEDDDPLATYNQFVQWTIKHYGEKDPKSGLKELLKDATTQFKDDPMYKNDLRYLKMWALYARQLHRAEAAKIYAFLVDNGIGTTYSALYEDYANLLERDGKRKEAEGVYIQGIERQVRPLERLKTRYREFQARSASSSEPVASGSGSRSVSSSTTPGASSSTPSLTSFNSTPESRYALMLAPVPPGKRPEKLKFNMGLLFTDEGVEYSIQEARARSMGLLGKKWGPPPPSELPKSSSRGSSSIQVDFNDDGLKSTRNMGGRRRSMLGEPTVTINTKEALADVFGMYNSPERTSKLMIPGSKHVPLKKVEPVTPMPSLTPKPFSKENQNENLKTPSIAFRPFSDENNQNAQSLSRTTTPAVSKFSIFTGENNKTPFMTPRTAFAPKDSSTPLFSAQRGGAENAPRSAFKPLISLTEEAAVENTESVFNAEDKQPQPVFSKVFNPPPSDISLAPLRDVFTDDHGKPTPKSKGTNAGHERAKSQDVKASIGPAFTPFRENVGENKTPFKVFSLPGSENSENALGRANPFTPKTPNVFTLEKTPFANRTPFGEKPAFTPARAFTPFADKTPVKPPQNAFQPTQEEDEVERSLLVDDEVEAYDEDYVDDVEGEQAEEEEDYAYEEEPGEQYEASLAPEHIQEDYESESGSDGRYAPENVPLGGRFGQFNVMTPIIERTFEFGTVSRATPSERYNTIYESDGSPRGKSYQPFLRDELIAAQDAKRLAAELQEGTSEEATPAGSPEMDEDDGTNGESAYGPVPQEVEERTGALSLGDTLTLNSTFRPPNPCNPFDPPILSALLSRIQPDSHFYDLRDRPNGQLEQLRKFFKKTGRKASSVASEVFPLVLENNRFQLSEKLGEGGFGSVFKARDRGVKFSDEENDDDEDDDFDDLDDDDGDEDSASMVAIKVTKPRNLWEYHALRRLHSALPLSLRRSLVIPHALYAYKDESFLVLDLGVQGMLLDIVNNAVSAGVSQAGACLDELLVVFFSIELLRLVEGMHDKGFIHGDLKIDNCLLRLEDVPGGAAAWSAMYSPNGDGGWSHKGLKIIDFGRTIDTRLFARDQQFIADWPSDERDCLEVWRGMPWTFQTDYFGLAGIVYCMLFGKYITAAAVVETRAHDDGKPRYKIGTPFKRYWQAAIWNKLFDILLNPELVRGGELPVSSELAEVRLEMETWLQANCNRTSNTLKGLLKKVEMSCYR